MIHQTSAFPKLLCDARGRSRCCLVRHTCVSNILPLSEEIVAPGLDSVGMLERASVRCGLLWLHCGEGRVLEDCTVQV